MMLIFPWGISSLFHGGTCRYFIETGQCGLCEVLIPLEDDPNSDSKYFFSSYALFYAAYSHYINNQLLWATWSSGSCSCLWEGVGKMSFEGLFQPKPFYGMSLAAYYGHSWWRKVKSIIIFNYFNSCFSLIFVLSQGRMDYIGMRGEVFTATPEPSVVRTCTHLFWILQDRA